MPARLLLRLRVLAGARLPRPGPRIVLAAVLVTALVLLLAPDLAWARGGGGGHAGGGGGHSGGGGFGGGHSGGGGGGSGGGGGFGGGGFGGGGSGGSGGGGGFGGGLWFLPFFFGGGGGFLLLLVLALVVWWYLSTMRRRPRSYQPYDGPATFEPIPLRVDPTDEGLRELQTADPGFQPDAFLHRVRDAFFTLQKAWMERDMTPARPFMGRGLYLSWQTQVQQFLDLHKKNVLDSLALTDLSFAAASHGQRYDHLTVRLEAQAADYEVDEKTGDIVFGDRDVKPFTEYWTFERTAGTTTRSTGSLLDGTCPNCGAPIQLNEIGECEYCKAAVLSGRFDWVLVRIDQEDEWEAHRASRAAVADLPAGVSAQAARGLEALMAADPGLDAGAFQERVEMTYFLVQEAWQEADLEKVRGYLRPGLEEQWRAELTALRARGEHELWESLNVQGLEIANAYTNQGTDVVSVAIDAVAARQLLAADGQLLSGSRQDQRIPETWTFTRPAGVQTPAAGGVLAQKCPQCGAALALDDAGACASCGAQLADGTRDWQLADVQPPRHALASPSAARTA